MPNMLHEITIHAAPEAVYHLLTTSEGLQQWWTADAVAEPTEGAVAEFGFHGRGTVFRMRIDELVASRRVKWTCLGNDEEWEGTKIGFHISPAEGEAVVVHFAHREWRSLGGAYARCNTTWGALMYRLKAAAEGGAPGPLFSE